MQRRTHGFHLSPRFMPILAFAVASGVVAFLGLMRSPITVFLFVTSGWLITLCLHEFGHALAAYYGGDESVKERGYLTLDPLGYTDPMTSLFWPTVFLAMGGIGLPGGAVFINPAALRSRGWQSFVSAAGPIATLVCLLLLLLPMWIGLQGQFGTVEFWSGWTFLAFLLVTSLLFNLLPIPGFDGFGVIEPYLPYEVQRQAAVIRPIAFFVLFGLFLFVPAVNSAFMNMCLQASQILGIDFRLVFNGLRLYRFWR